MEFLVRFAGVHETFRVVELEALAIIENLDMKILEFNPDSPFCIISLPSIEDARLLLRRSILAQSIHQFWGQAPTLPQLHDVLKSSSSHLWPPHKKCTFKYELDSYRCSRSGKKRLAIFNEFKYLPFEGAISMENPEALFTIFEQWQDENALLGILEPDRYYFGWYIASSQRDIIHKYDLKKRDYISTTSMDSELSLVTANISLSGPGKLFYDPFCGTGSFPVACAHFGATAWGSDIDGRSMRGEGGKKSLKGNFEQYGIGSYLGDVFSSDLTNSPIRRDRIFDGIVCDPPYGVREGLRVLGIKDPEKSPWLIQWGKDKGMTPEYVPPKKPYSFVAMLDDILVFATETLVDNGRLSFWMPTANDEEQAIPVPTHPSLEIVSICVQVFVKWSRRLITYRRIPDDQVSSAALEGYAGRVKAVSNGTSANELNAFRQGYFKAFKTEEVKAEEVKVE